MNDGENFANSLITSSPTLAHKYFIFLRNFLSLCFLIFRRLIMIKPFFACLPASSLVLSFFGSSIILSMLMISSMTLLTVVGFSMTLLVSGSSKISLRRHNGQVIPTSLIKLVFCLAISGLHLNSCCSSFPAKIGLFVVVVGCELDEMLKFRSEQASNRVETEVPKMGRHLKMSFMLILIHLLPSLLRIIIFKCFRQCYEFL